MNEKRMISTYEIIHAIQISFGEVVLAEDCAAAAPYMVCDCAWDNPFSVREYSNIAVSEDYLEIMSEFLSRVASHVAAVEYVRNEHGIVHTPLTEADCIKDSKYENFQDQLVVIKPECLTPSLRTADHQLVYATSGFGCRPDSRGSAVYAFDIITGQSSRYERRDVAGIIDPAKIPQWAVDKLAALRKEQATPSHYRSSRMTYETR